MPTHEMIELACIAVTAIALVTQTIVLIAFTMGASKAIKALKEEIEEMRTSIMPTVHTVRELVERLSPKVEQTVTDLSAFASGLRKQAAEVEEVASEVLARVRKETGRIDNMFSGTLDAVDKASNYVTHAVSKPIKQISGILASVKAVIEALSKPEVHSNYRRASVSDEKDMFV
jgi:phage-related protein